MVNHGYRRLRGRGVYRDTGAVHCSLCRAWGGRVRCLKCEIENPAAKKFCGDCEAPLANLCPKCGADNPTGKRFLGDCGVALAVFTAPAAKQSGSAPIRLAESSASETL